MNNLDLKPNNHNRQNVDQLLKRNDQLFHFRTSASFYDMPCCALFISITTHITVFPRLD